MKTERIYLRTKPETKQYLQRAADQHFEGSLSALFDFMIERLDLHLDVEGEEE